MKIAALVIPGPTNTDSKPILCNFLTKAYREISLRCPTPRVPFQGLPSVRKPYERVRLAYAEATTLDIVDSRKRPRRLIEEDFMRYFASGAFKIVVNNCAAAVCSRGEIPEGK